MLTFFQSRSLTIEALPTEVKIGILRQVPDIATLRSIIFACPAFHQSYLIARKEVLTLATLSQLQKRQIHILDAVPYMEVCLEENRRPDLSLHTILQTVFDQFKAGKPIKLEITDCICLLKIKGAKRWVLNSKSEAKALDYFSTTVSYPLGHRNYYGTFFARLPMLHTEALLRKVKLVHERDHMIALEQEQVCLLESLTPTMPFSENSAAL